MRERLYTGTGKTLSSRGIDPPLFPDIRLYSREGYIPDQGLLDAVHVALTLGQPLLLTGDPGTGKTELAFAIADEIEFPVFEFRTKSTSVYTDLFYRYDSIRHFLDAQLKREKPIGSYIEFGPLGKAILNAMDRADPACPPEYCALPQTRSIVLVDEIDKAPRDLPNDILSEIVEMDFEVKETGTRYSAGHKYRPVLVFTSNQEKDLPDAFRRRCIFYHIEFPGPARLAVIVERRLGISPTDDHLQQALALFMRLRQLDLDKKPGTAELLAWISLLEREKIGTTPVRQMNDSQISALLSSISVLAKSERDLRVMRDDARE
jgi:MoxR-like ATPase